MVIYHTMYAYLMGIAYSSRSRPCPERRRVAPLAEINAHHHLAPHAATGHGHDPTATAVVYSDARVAAVYAGQFSTTSRHLGYNSFYALELALALVATDAPSDRACGSGSRGVI